jgi:hypothetical protein
MPTRKVRTAKPKKAASKKSDFDEVYARLRKILAAYAGRCTVTKDDAKSYWLEVKDRTGPFFDSLPEKQRKKPIMFAATIKGKAYVSFHLIPVYAFPDLLDRASPELRKRMQGKSCFNFTSVDERLFSELAKLTKAGAEAVRTRACPGSCS